MATELPPVTVATPAPETTITPVVRKSRWGRVFDVVAGLAAFAVALLGSMGDINFAALGFSPTQAAWAGVVLFAVRFALTYRPVRLVDVKVDPAPGGQPR